MNLSGDDDVPPQSGLAADATLHELAGKLSEVREQLEQVVVDLAELGEVSRGSRISRRPAGRTGTGHRLEGGSLQCQVCGRRRPMLEATGWTLRLCADDELHPFCPDCDHRQVGEIPRNGTESELVP